MSESGSVYFVVVDDRPQLYTPFLLLLKLNVYEWTVLCGGGGLGNDKEKSLIIKFKIIRGPNYGVVHKKKK